jgi:hypothetical protein
MLKSSDQYRLALLAPSSLRLQRYRRHLAGASSVERSPAWLTIDYITCGFWVSRRRGASRLLDCTKPCVASRHIPISRGDNCRIEWWGQRRLWTHQKAENFIRPSLPWTCGSLSLRCWAAQDTVTKRKRYANALEVQLSLHRSSQTLQT